MPRSCRRACVNVVVGDGARRRGDGRGARSCAGCASPAAGRSGGASSKPLLDRPELLIALEMGGKNACVVLDDCGAAPSRARGRRRRLSVGGSALHRHRARARPSQDRRPFHRCAREGACASFGSASRRSRACSPGRSRPRARSTKVEHAIETARKAGVEPIVAGEKLPGGYYRTPSLHRVPDGEHHVAGYTDFEVFGPDLSVEVIDSDEEAIAVLDASPYRVRQRRVHRLVASASSSSPRRRSRACSIAIARRTSRARKLPFGGVGKSGNYRPAGAWAHRNVTAPLAMLENVIGAVTPHPQLAQPAARVTISIGSSASTPRKRTPRLRAR